MPATNDSAVPARSAIPSTTVNVQLPNSLRQVVNVIETCSVRVPFYANSHVLRTAVSTEIKNFGDENEIRFHHWMKKLFA